MFKTEPEEGLNGRSLNYPRGKVIGGSSSINAMIYMRGHAADYDHWRGLGLGRRAAALQAARGSFSRCERKPRGRRRMAGRATAGALGPAGGVSRCRDASRHQADPGFQHRRQRRLVLFPRQPEARQAVVGGARLSQAGAVAPQPAARDRLPRRAHRIRRTPCRRGAMAAGRHDASRARPRHHPGGRQHRLAASPAAVGRRPGGAAPAARHSGRVLDRAGVGENLHDHLQLRAIFRVTWARRPSTRPIIRCSGASAWGCSTHYFLGAGRSPWRPRSSACSPARTHRASVPTSSFTCSRCRWIVSASRLHSFPAFTASVCNVQPTSRGHLRLKSADPAAAPAIKPNYLATDEDRRVAADSLRVVRRIVAQPALRRFEPQEYLPGTSVGDDDLSLVKAALRRRHHELPPRRYPQDGARQRPARRGR